jgi:hypothetical protein
MQPWDRENSWSCPNSAIRRELSCGKLDPQTAISPRRRLFDEAWSDEIPPTQSRSEDLAAVRAQTSMTAFLPELNSHFRLSSNVRLVFDAKGYMEDGDLNRAQVINGPIPDWHL